MTYASPTFQDHFQALYDAMRTAMDGASYNAVPLLHTYTGDSSDGASVAPPFVTYRQDVERPTGTFGGGPAKVLRSSWMVTAFTPALGDGLSIISAIVEALAPADIVTDDGYVTTYLGIDGVQSLYDEVGHVYATLLRLDWERSA